MAPPKSHVQDVLLSLGLLLLFSLPLAYLFPATFASFAQLFYTLWTTILWLIFTLVVLVLTAGTALIGEKAYKRFALGQRPDDRIGEVSEGASIDEQRRAKRVTRENRMEQAAEKVVDKLEATGVGKLFRRHGAGVKSSRKGKEKAANQDEVELDDLRSRGTSSGITRAPPPLPPR